MVARASGNDSGSRPADRSAASSVVRPAAGRPGVVLYADANHPSPRRATRRRPAAEPQLPTQIGTDSPSSSARRTVRAASKRDHRSSKGMPTAA